MKCSLCNNEWNIPPSISSAVKFCPFCGGKLPAPPEDFSADYAVLRYIYEHFGCDLMKDGSRLLACFSDLAPTLRVEKRMLAYFVECNGHKKMIALIHSTKNEQMVCANQLVREMNDVMLIDEEASRKICDAFLFALTGHHLSDAPQKSASAGNGASRKDATQQSGSNDANRQHIHSGSTLVPNVDGPLAEALRTLESIRDPNSAVQSRIRQYRSILKTAGRYMQLHAQPYGPYYFSVEYRVRKDAVYAEIDYSGFAGNFPDPGRVHCNEKTDSDVTIEAVGINKYTFKGQTFTFKFQGKYVQVTGSDGFGHQTCKRVQ